jgi:hypothetical protein
MQPSFHIWQKQYGTTVHYTQIEINDYSVKINILSKKNSVESVTKKTAGNNFIFRKRFSLSKNGIKVFDHIFPDKLILKFSGDHSLTPCIYYIFIIYGPTGTAAVSTLSTYGVNSQLCILCGLRNGTTTDK